MAVVETEALTVVDNVRVAHDVDDELKILDGDFVIVGERVALTVVDNVRVAHEVDDELIIPDGDFV